jgi:hypothetical protein
MLNGINNLVKKLINSSENQPKQKTNLTEKKTANNQNTKVEDTPIKQRETKDILGLQTSADDLESEMADAMSDDSQISEEADIRKSQENLASNDGMNDYVLVNLENKELVTKDLQKDDNNSKNNIENQVQQANEPNENLTSRLQFYANTAYEFLPEINKDKIGALLYISYKVVFNNDRDVAVINELVDISETENILKDDTIYRLANLDATQFHSILMSQIIAKNENIHLENNFIEILSKIVTNVKKQSNQTTDQQSFKKLCSMITSSLNIIIQETLANIADLNKEVNLSEHIKLIEYNYEEKSLEYVKSQFIKDALRKPGVCLQLMQEDKIFWDSNDSEELKQLSEKLNNTEILTEQLKEDIGEKIFAIYIKQINKYLVQHNIKNYTQVAILILLELTQAGVALGATVLSSVQTTLTEKLAIPNNYYGKGQFDNHNRSNNLIYQDNNLVLKQSVIFSPGFMIQDSLGNKIAATKDVNITSDLQINPNVLENSRYDNIGLSMGKLNGIT